jgi:hypothetical protein
MASYWLFQVLVNFVPVFPDHESKFSFVADEIREEPSTTVADQIHRNNPFYKSVMCKNKSNCAYGENCVYAHDPSELRKVQIVSISKTLPQPKNQKFICRFADITRFGPHK